LVLGLNVCLDLYFVGGKELIRKNKYLNVKNNVPNYNEHSENN